MSNKQVTLIYRRLIVCPTLCLTFAISLLSCLKDDGLKQTDSNAFTKAQAKDYFEKTARTLKFLTTGATAAGTKSADYSLTENMIIEWGHSLEGENAESYIVEVPIRMASPIIAMLYDGLGHINKNIRQVPLNTSLLIEKHKDDGCMHHSVVITVGSYSKNGSSSKYPFLSDKTTFTGYQIFCSEDGALLCSKHFTNGRSESRNLYTEAQILKVDSVGNDLTYRGISFVFNGSLIQTKGGASASPGEDSTCPACGNVAIYWGYSGGSPSYFCSFCDAIVYTFIDNTEDVCEKCQLSKSLCICKCPFCSEDPCICEGNVELCPHCREYGCDGSCQNGNGSGNNGTGSGYHISVLTYSATPFGSVSILPEKAWYNSNDTITLTASPFTGYHFAGWKLDENIVSTQNPYSFTVHVNQTYYAIFEINE